MITSIVTGSGNSRRVHTLPAADGSAPAQKDAEGKTYGNAPSGRIRLTKAAKADRIAIGNLLKDALWPNGKGYKRAMNQGAKRAAAYNQVAA